MTITDSFKAALNNAFIYTVFLRRDKETFVETINLNVRKSLNCIIPTLDKVRFENVDLIHDKITFFFDDVTFSAIITWKLSSSGLAYVFMGME